jgi:integrase
MLSRKMNRMGVTKRPNGSWRARVLGPDGRERASHHKTKAAALRWEREQLAERDKGQWVDKSSITVATYARQWAAARPHRPTTAQRVNSLIERHIAATRLGERRLSAVRPSEVQAWATDRAGHLSPGTMRVLLGLLRSVYAAAVLDRLVAVSPVQRVKLAEHRPDRVVPLTVEQVRTWSEAVPPHMCAAVITQAGLGLRIGELLGLRVSDVDFLRRTVRIEVQRSRTRELVAPKTPRSRRSIPLPAVVSDALAAHLAEHGAADDGGVFANERGKPWHHVTFMRLLKTGAIKAGLPESSSSHDLRHTYCCWLLQAGVDVVTVAERMGHESAQMIWQTYGHVIPGQEDRTRRAIDAVWTENTDSIRTPRSRQGADQ